jgi:hypothetical protein
MHDCWKASRREFVMLSAAGLGLATLPLRPPQPRRSLVPSRTELFPEPIVVSCADSASRPRFYSTSASATSSWCGWLVLSGQIGKVKVVGGLRSAQRGGRASVPLLLHVFSPLPYRENAISISS